MTILNGKPIPIIRLDFSNMETGSEESFRETLFDRLNEIATFYGIKIQSEIVSHYFWKIDPKSYRRSLGKKLLF